MRKIENLLLVPFLLIVLALCLRGHSTLDIHLHDTYYVIAPWPLAQLFVVWLFILFLLYKLIRKRRQFVNNWWAISHITVTTLLTGLIWFSYLFNNRLPRWYISDSLETTLRIWAAYNQLLVISCMIFLFVQVIFLIYFIVQMIKPRRLANSQ